MLADDASRVSIGDGGVIRSGPRSLDTSSAGCSMHPTRVGLDDVQHSFDRTHMYTITLGGVVGLTPYAIMGRVRPMSLLRSIIICSASLLYHCRLQLL